MRFSLSTSLSWLLTTSTLSANVNAGPVDNEAHTLSKRAYDAISGIPGNACSRMEIRDLQSNNPDQFNLFLLALQSLMDMDQKEKFSFYQLAGIHGRPFVAWNDVPLQRNGAYCPHVSNMFLPWHRPYLVAIERAIDDNIYKVKAQFPADQRSRWDRAHNCFRLPYWDSARRDSGGDALPSLILQEQVTLDTPQGRQSRPNPLAFYQFHPISNEMATSGKFRQWDRTYRIPTSAPASNIEAVRNVMNQQQPRLRDRVYDVMTNVKFYRQMSTSATGGNTGNPENHESVESIHDTPHYYIGGRDGGNMYYLDYSAMDPVFWMHHANIDRLGAIWQKIYPTDQRDNRGNMMVDSYVRPGATTRNNGVWASGTMLNDTSNLLPFTQKTDGTFWTPQSARYTETFGYFYPETRPGSTSQSASSDINRMYGPSRTQQSTARDNSGNSNSNNNGLFSGFFRKRSLQPLSARAAQPFEAYEPEVGQRSYTVTITSDKDAVEGSYGVYIFLGDGKTQTGGPGMNLNLTIPLVNMTIGIGAGGDLPSYDPNDSSTFVYSPNYVGTYAVVSSYEKMDDVAIISGNVPLTTTLQLHYDAGLLESMEDAVVQEYLKENLEWKVVVSDGTVIPSEDMPNLTVGVVSQKLMTASTESTFPVYGDLQTHKDATAGKPAGYDLPEPIEYNSPVEVSVGSPSVCAEAVEYVYVDEAGKFVDLSAVDSR